MDEYNWNQTDLAAYQINIKRLQDIFNSLSASQQEDLRRSMNADNDLYYRTDNRLMKMKVYRGCSSLS